MGKLIKGEGKFRRDYYLILENKGGNYYFKEVRYLKFPAVLHLRNKLLLGNLCH